MGQRGLERAATDLAVLGVGLRQTAQGVGGKTIMSLFDRKPQGILQVVEWRAVPDGFKQSFKVRNAQQGCHWRQCFLKGNSDQGRIQIGKEDVSNILSRKNSSQWLACPGEM